MFPFKLGIQLAGQWQPTLDGQFAGLHLVILSVRKQPQRNMQNKILTK